MKYVVTGSAGFIGRNTVQALVEGGKDVLSITTSSVISERVGEQLKGSEIFHAASLQAIPLEVLQDATIVHCAWDNVRGVGDVSHYLHAHDQIRFLDKIRASGAKKTSRNRHVF